MICMYIAAVCMWLIVGALVLAQEKVSKVDYGIAWVVLMINLIADLVIKLIENYLIG